MEGEGCYVRGDLTVTLSKGQVQVVVHTWFPGK